MRRGLAARRALRFALGTLAVLFLVVLAGLFVLTSTDFGRERMRRFALSALRGQAHGFVRIGAVSGNLLRGVTLHHVSITDSAGAPFVAFEEAHARYGLLALLRKRVVLADVRLVRPVVVLDRRTGEAWNFDRIFPPDTTPDADTTQGWGDWLMLSDITVIGGRVQVRSPWRPDSTLTGAVRDSAVREALGGGSRLRVVRVADGFQKVSDFREITGQLPLLRLAHPAHRTKRIEVTRLRTIAEAFNPPAADVRDLSGAFEFTGDSIWWRGARLVLPASRISGDGAYVYDSGDMRLRLRGAPAALADLRWIYPRLPSTGQGTLDFALDWRGNHEDYLARNAEMRIGASQIAGDFGIAYAGDTVTFHDTRLRYRAVDTRLLEQIFPWLRSPRRGTLTGRTTVAGRMDAMQVDGDVTFDDAAGGRSRVIALGELGLPDAGGFTARDLRLTLAPAQVSLVRTMAPDIPIGGVLTGRATLDGSTAARLSARADVTHDDGGARSRLVGHGTVRTAGGVWLDLDLRAAPIALATVGRFVPALGLRGSASGPLRVRGTLRDLGVRGTLTLTPGGTLTADARLDLASRAMGFEVAAGLRVFDLHAVMARAPSTSLTATTRIRGRGTDPATMRLVATLDMETSSYDSIAIDTGSVRLAIGDGLLRVDTVMLRGPYARAAVWGEFGLAPGRTGELAYHLDVDSLTPFQRWLPQTPDTGLVRPRPGQMARAIRRARADSARIAAATEVERAVSGDPGPQIAVAAPQPVRRDSVSGTLYAAGRLRGGTDAYALRGRAGSERLVLRGNTVRAARLEYGVTGGAPRTPTVVLAAQADSVTAAGFALDSVDARIAYTSPGGQAQLVVWQDRSREYSMRGDFALHLDHSELHLGDVALRFDTTLWRSVRPGTVRWGARGIEVAELELRSPPFGRIYVDGLLPTEGQADLRVEMDNFEAGHLIDLLQSAVPLRGLVSLSAEVSGTGRAPRLRGAVGIVNGRYDETALPELHGTIAYADRLLITHVEAARGGGRPIAVLDGRVPVDLALEGVTGDRLLEAPLAVDFVADSLPLELIPYITDVVSNVAGRSAGTLTLRGTPRRPALSGGFVLDRGRFRIVSTGMPLRDVAGVLRLSGDTARLDSLVGRSGDGIVRLQGTLGVESLTRPSFDLQLTASNARLLDNDQGRVNADGEITIRGPFDRVVVEGTGRVLNGVVYLPEPDDKEVISTGDPSLFNVVDTSLAANREVFPGQSPLLKNLRANVGLQVSRGTWVRSRDANIEIFTADEGLSIEVDRGRSAITVDGSVSSDRGDYTFLTKRFQIRRGSATFIGAPELNPTLQLTGEYEVRLPSRALINIRVLIGGTLTKPRLTLESDAQPPMSQSDLLSYLAFGRSSSSLLQLEGSSVSGATAGGGLVGAGAALAGKRLASVALGVALSEVEGEASRSIGADVFNVTPADLPTEFWEPTGYRSFLLGTEVEIGKYANPRTFVAVQARSGIPGLRVQHRLPRGGLRLEGSFGPRFLLTEPTLAPVDAPAKTGVFGAFVIREWRF